MVPAVDRQKIPYLPQQSEESVEGPAARSHQSRSQLRLIGGWARGPRDARSRQGGVALRFKIGFGIGSVTDMISR